MEKCNNVKGGKEGGREMREGKTRKEKQGHCKGKGRESRKIKYRKDKRGKARKSEKR